MKHPLSRPELVPVTSIPRRLDILAHGRHDDRVFPAREAIPAALLDAQIDGLPHNVTDLHDWKFAKADMPGSHRRMRGLRYTDEERRRAFAAGRWANLAMWAVFAMDCVAAGVSIVDGWPQ